MDFARGARQERRGLPRAVAQQCAFAALSPSRQRRKTGGGPYRNPQK